MRGERKPRKLKPCKEAHTMEKTTFINLIKYESSNKADLVAICHKYGLSEDRIYWDNFTFHLDVFRKEVK